MFFQRFRQALRLWRSAVSGDSVRSHRIEVVVLDGRYDPFDVAARSAGTSGVTDMSDVGDVGADSEVPVAKSAVSDLATDVWWLRHWIEKTPHDDANDDLNRVRRAMTHLWDTVEKSGINVHDHVGEAYDPGLSLHVLAFQPNSTVTEDIVGETLKPSISYRDRIIQVGEVIVHTPVDPTTSEARRASAER